MKLLALSIDDFRGIHHTTMRLGDHDVFVGPNGSGKSTIIDALSLVFGRTRLVRDLTEHDFYASCPDATSRIRPVATLGGFTGNDPDRHDAWFREGRAVPKFRLMARIGFHGRIRRRMRRYVSSLTWTCPMSHQSRSTLQTSRCLRERGHRWL